MDTTENKTVRIHGLGTPDYQKFLTEPGGTLHGQQVDIDEGDLLISTQAFDRLRELDDFADFAASGGAVWVGGVEYEVTFE